MRDGTVDGEIVESGPRGADSSRKSGGRRKREPSATKLRAAALYASGQAKTLKAAIVEAGGSPTGVARVPGPNGWGSVALVRIDLEHNPTPASPRAMCQDGLRVLHGLALNGESEAVKGGAADKLVGRLEAIVSTDDTSSRGLREAAVYAETVAWLLILGARVGARLGPRAVELLEERRAMLPAPDKVALAMRPRSVQAALDEALSIHKGTNEPRPARPFLALRRGLLAIPGPRSEATTYTMEHARAREIPSKGREDGR